MDGRSPIDSVQRWAAYLPDRPALSGNGETLTYAELDRRAQRTAVYLTEELGLVRGDRVAWLSQNDVFFFELAFACFRAGLVLAPLNWRLAPPELDALLALCEPATLFVDEANAALLDRLSWPGRDRAILVGAYLAAPPPPRQPRQPFVGAGMDEPALLLCTSGTTGRPKAAVLPARQLFWNAVNTALAWELTRGDSTVLYTPLFHTGAINVLAVPLLQVGGRVEVHPRLDAPAIVAALQAGRVTVLFGVPTTFQLLADSRGFFAAARGGLRLALCGGAPLPLSLIQRYADEGLVLTQGFGMTEVGPNCFFLPPQEARARAGSVGKPMPYCQARLRVGEREAAPGEVGELQLAGPHVCAGYFRDPAASAAALTPDGWFATGDLARRDADGWFHVAGRQKEMFISGGENVYPAEVEVALAGHPAVAEAAVVAMPDARWGEVGCAFVVWRGEGVSADELRRHLRGQLAGYKVPKAIVPVAALPRNPSGKLLKDALVREASCHAA